MPKEIYNEYTHFVQRFSFVNSFPPQKPLVTVFDKMGRWDVRLQGIINAKRITGWTNAAFANLMGFVRLSWRCGCPIPEDNKERRRDGNVNLSHFQTCVGDSRQIFLDRTIYDPWEECNSHFLGQKKITLSKWEVVNF